MHMNLHELGVYVDKQYAQLPNKTPVVAQSSTSGMCWGIGRVVEAKVTEEMRVMGCDLPLDATILLITLD